MATRQVPLPQQLPQQLPLLEIDVRVPRTLRLDDRTRRLGMVGVAQMKAQLAEQARRRAEREAAEIVPFVRKAA
jgi:hypothetical protein